MLAVLASVAALIRPPNLPFARGVLLSSARTLTPLAQNADVAALLSLLVHTASTDEEGTVVPPAARATLGALEAVWAAGDIDGYDVDPAGRWRVVTFTGMRARLAELSLPLVSMASCELIVADSGPAAYQSEVQLDMVVDARGQPVRVSWGGVVALEEREAAAVFLRAEAFPATKGLSDESGLDVVEAALAPSLPPGAIRARLPIAWLDESVCALRLPGSGILVLERIADDEQPTVTEAIEDGADAISATEAAWQAATEAAPAGSAGSEGSAGAVVDAVVSAARDTYLGGDEEDDEDEGDEGREVWVGSPY